MPELLGAQAYRLASWREAGEALNYRRFFDVTSLVAVRVEDPVVFMATHALLLSLHGHGEVDGFRIDHPDGLADPQGYLDRLADATGGAWVVVEKILEGEETLPGSWRCAGTTGYDALLRVQQVLTPTAGLEVLDRLWADAAPDRASLDDVITDAKRLVVDDVQAAEVDRLMRLVRRVLGDIDSAAVRRALEALLVAMDRYRAYVPARGVDPEQQAVVEQAAERAQRLLAPSDLDALGLVVDLVLGRDLPEAQLDTRAVADDFRLRFQQTCGPVMAKGIEDTAYYRWFRLAGANEVGGHPDHPSITAERVPRLVRASGEHLADLDDDADDPRHQTVGGRPRPAHAAGRGRQGVGGLGRGGPHDRGALPRRGARRSHRVPPLADAHRHLADQRCPSRGVRAQGGPRGQGAHRVGRRRRRLRGRGRRLRPGGCPRSRGEEAPRRLDRCARAVGPREHPRPEASSS